MMLIKTIFDYFFAFIGLILFLPILTIISILIFFFDGVPIFFVQERIGFQGRSFRLIKFRTMTTNHGGTCISVKGEPRITKIGYFLRKYKLDELPELYNVLIGDMSFVGPRPDVPGYLDKLKGDDRLILNLKPGITGPASLKYIDEEEILSHVENPKEYNDMIIFPDKVRINKLYYCNWSFKLDIKIILHTFIRKIYKEENYF